MVRAIHSLPVPGSPNSFCVIGPADAHKKKLRALEAAGVTQFNIYLMCGDEEQTLDIYGRDIIPHVIV